MTKRLFYLSETHTRSLLRVALSHYVTNGVTAALGLLLITGSFHLLMGPASAAAASVGVIVCIPADQPAPKRGKFLQLIPAAIIGLPLFFAVQLLHSYPLYLGLLLVPATFMAFLGAAWGKRGLPISVSIMFAMIFSMAAPHSDNGVTAIATSMHFALGAFLYVIYATAINALLNSRYRVQMLADTLLALANLLRTQAGQFRTSDTELDNQPRQDNLLAKILQEQSALADQLQTARDIVLEAPRTAERQKLAGMLLQILEMRDHLLVCGLDIDALKTNTDHQILLQTISTILQIIATDIETLADALLCYRKPDNITDHRAALTALQSNTQPHQQILLVRSLTGRVAFINDEAVRLAALARAESQPDLVVIRAAWQLFVSPNSWSWRPLASLWGWDAPPLRHAVRAALAIGAAYALSLAMPWGTHDYWILVTIVVVLRGSLAQTLERRNNRVFGTLVGCILAGIILALHPPAFTLLITVTLAQAVAHAFGARRYLITAISATLLGLLQAHMLHTGGSPVFDAIERIADTLIGVIIAWPFSYLLPSWERKQIPALINRTLTAQARHAHFALGLGQLNAVDNTPEVDWRLARREAYDSLSALVQAIQRSLAEPRAVRPPLAQLEYLLAHSYQLLAQLTAAKTLLLMRRGRLNDDHIGNALVDTSAVIGQLLSEQSTTENSPGESAARTAESADITLDVTLPHPVSDPLNDDLSPWLLRRLNLAKHSATLLRNDAVQILHSLASPTQVKS